MAEEFKKIFETYNASDIAFLKSLLDAHDIAYIVKNENVVTFYSLSGIPMILEVEAEKFDEAVELLKDFQGGRHGQGTV